MLPSTLQTKYFIMKSLNVLLIKDEIRRHSQRYRNRLEDHPNALAANLMREVKTIRRLKRNLLQDLTI